MELWIILNEDHRIARGHTCDVYRHPDDPGLLVKVIRRSAIEERYGSGQPWYKSRRRRYKHFIGFLREVREQIALRATGQPHPWYLQNIVGFADTQHGFALVVEAVRGRDGTYAPTVSQLIERNQLTATVLGHLEEFCNALVGSPIVLADLNVHNVVYGYTPERGEHFVLVDGVGHKNLIPVQLIAPTFKRWNNLLKVRRFLAHVARRQPNVQLAAQT